MKFISFLFSPIVFALGFLAPLIAQILDATGFAITGFDNLYIGLLCGGLLGLMAKVRGSWVWVKP